jgi:hypothetical protein
LQIRTGAMKKHNPVYEENLKALMGQKSATGRAEPF